MFKSSIIAEIKRNVFVFFSKKKISIDDVSFQKTENNFSGDLTFVLFNIVRKNNLDLKKTGEELGNFLLKNKLIKSFSIINGFFNFILKDEDVISILKELDNDRKLLTLGKKKQLVIVEYSSPNTNKPLHLGHLRNIFIGYSVSKILKSAGYDIKTVTLINDRGIHICKSMIAYLKAGENSTPEKENIKGDHFVGNFYVKFENLLREQKEKLKIEDEKLPLMIEAQDMLKKWEEKDSDVLGLWKKMNSWVISGFEETYKKLDVFFDKTYYESETYLLGKNIVNEGLRKNIFYKKEDGSVWVDLTDVKLGEKLLLRGDGTSVYITQDLGTADTRYEEFHAKKMIYVVGDEQEHHFKVLKNIFKKLEKPYADEIYHLSYGMIDLPSGRMKSREGTVVDADNLIEEMIEKAEKKVKELEKIDVFNCKEKKNIFKNIGLAALKIFLLKVDPKKRLTFDPNKSIDFSGDTGPFILYAIVRIYSLLEKYSKNFSAKNIDKKIELSDIEKKIILKISEYKNILNTSAQNLTPAILVQYAISLTKDFNKMYENLQILREKDKNKMILRLVILKLTFKILKKILTICGVKVIKKM